MTSQEVELDDGTATAAALNAYLTEETVQPGQPRADRAILLLPPATGWKHAPTRRLADRLAIICRCLVLLPDLLRGGAPFDAAAVSVDGGYAAWAAEQPPARLAADVRASAVYLRADHRVRGLGVVGPFQLPRERRVRRVDALDEGVGADNLLEEREQVGPGRGGHGHDAALRHAERARDVHVVRAEEGAKRGRVHRRAVQEQLGAPVADGAAHGGGAAIFGTTTVCVCAREKRESE